MMNKSNLVKLLNVILKEVIVLKTYLQQLEDAYQLNNLFGDLLDQYGRNLGIKRYGVTDEVYRRKILSMLLTRKLFGRKVDVLEALTSFTGLDIGKIDLTEDSVGHFTVTLPVTIPSEGIEEVIENSKPVGVNYTLVWKGGLWDEMVWDEGEWST